MIPQLDMSNFLLTGSFILLFFLLFIYMVRVMFAEPIEEHMKKYKDQLNALKLQKTIYLKEKKLKEEEQSRLELEIKEIINEAQQSIIKESKEQLMTYEDELLENFNIKINNLYDSLNKKYNKENFSREIVEFMHR